MNTPPPDRPDGPQRSSGAQNPPRPGPLPAYKLILHSKAAADMMFTVQSIMDLTRLCRHEATHKMWEAHHVGQSQLLITFKERGEFYVEQFAARGLTVTLEPA
jgi:ATP-dependent Clp protease adapter protein ClpS